MIIAIISDIHDAEEKLKSAMEEIEKRYVSQILFLGDFVTKRIAKKLLESNIPVFGIWGNCDGNKVEITRLSMKKGSNLKMALDTYAIIKENKFQYSSNDKDEVEVKTDGKTIFMTHDRDLVEHMAKSNDFDAIFYGHKHEIENKVYNEKCCIVNPGAICGNWSTKKSTFAIYNTKTNSAEIIEL
ncbi:MAG: YfcE family phosphodiesterase [Methanomassiliicoccales archaeon]|nr:MAG: YfcE family phosphodiesterase [Methanomassiliicoccales archaeon]